MDEWLKRCISREFPFLSLETREQIEDKMSTLYYRWLYISLTFASTACIAGVYAYYRRGNWLPQLMAFIHVRTGIAYHYRLVS